MYIVTGKDGNGKIYRFEREGYTSAMLLAHSLKERCRNIQMYQEKEIWTAGRRGCTACIAITIYEHSIVATAEKENLTAAMMERALKHEFPEHTFYNSDHGGNDYLRADADRWTNDGL